MKFLFLAGIVFFIGSIILIVSNYEKFDVERNGRIVKMEIVSLPKSCIGAKVRYSVSFIYNGKLYDKQTRGNFCEIHYVGEFIDIKMLEESKYILFPNESAFFDLMSFGVLGLFGLFLSIIQFKKMKNEK